MKTMPLHGAYSPVEMMTIAASRLLSNDDVCLVGIGAPSVACNLARLTHAPDLRLIYESGTIGTRPEVLPLSIGDPELCETALTTISLPEVFRYWIQGGRISVGFLGGAQIDRFGNLNSTVIGDYEAPRVRLPGAGGAPEIASGCREIYIIMELSERRFVERVDFITSFGYGEGGNHRAELGLDTRGPTTVVTDLCILKPHPVTKELMVRSIHPGVSREEISGRCGWPVRFFDPEQTPAPSTEELRVLRDLHRRTEKAHAEDAV
ncbi:MAG TPA: CoA-transferase subunit beta [Chthoniobacteraceae bacterium]|nr:CoA-transferase subunit beta [Chthoniobacteraceae bacterium]